MAINDNTFVADEEITHEKLNAMYANEINSTDDIHPQYTKFNVPAGDADHRYMVYFAYYRSGGNSTLGRYTKYKSNIPVSGPSVSVLAPENFINAPIADEILIRKKSGCNTLTIEYTDGIVDSILYVTLKTYTGVYVYSGGALLDHTNFLRSQDPTDDANHDRSIVIDISAISANQIIRVMPYVMINTLALSSGPETQEHYLKIENLTIAQS